MEKLRTHYDNLQVMRIASPEVIKAAYRSLSQKHHPDRNPPERQDECARIMKVINRSYEVLSDPELRSNHDRWIAQRENPSPESKKNPFSDQSQQDKKPPRPTTPANPELFKAGSISWKHLPTAAKELLNQIRIKPSENEVSARSFSFQPIAWGLVVALGGLLFLYGNAAKERWTGDADQEVMYLTFAAMLFVSGLIVLLVQLQSIPPGRALIVTRTHIVHVNLTSVTVWSIAGTERFILTTFKKNGNFERSEIVFAHNKGGNRTFTLYDEAKATVAHTLVRHTLIMTDADPRGCERELARSPLSSIATGGFQGASYWQTAGITLLASIVATWAFHWELLRPTNLQAPIMAGLPPARPSPLAYQPPAGFVVDPVPDQQVAAFDEPLAPLPRTGWLRRPQRGLIAPMVIHTQPGTNYYFKVIDGRSQTVGTFFVRGGETISVDMPLGSYNFHYAYGPSWYGTNYLFGPETRYTALVGSMDFTRNSEHVEGVELTLIKQEHGNMHESALSPESF